MYTTSTEGWQITRSKKDKDKDKGRQTKDAEYHVSNIKTHEVRPRKAADKEYSCGHILDSVLDATKRCTQMESGMNDRQRED